MKCQKCNSKVVRYPFKDEQGKIIWKNLFKIDIVSILFIIAIIFMTFGYAHDTQYCRELLSDPCDFCEESNCCKIANQYKPTFETTGTEFNFTINE
jgi:hypothetical protein